MGIEGFNTAFAATAASPVLDFDEPSILSLVIDSACSVVPFNILLRLLTWSLSSLKFDFHFLCRSLQVVENYSMQMPTHPIFKIP